MTETCTDCGRTLSEGYRKRQRGSVLPPEIFCVYCGRDRREDGSQLPTASETTEAACPVRIHHAGR